MAYIPIRILIRCSLHWGWVMIKVNILEAKTHFSQYIDRVVEGEVVVVCRHNRPVAELRAVEAEAVRPARVAGLFKGQVHWEPDAFAPMPDEEVTEFDGTPVVPEGSSK